MTKKLFLFVSSIVFSATVFSQHEADTSYFGTLAGLDFSSGSPIVLRSAFRRKAICRSLITAGKCIGQQSGINAAFTFGKEYAKGVYFVKVISGNRLKTYKVIRM